MDLARRREEWDKTAQLCAVIFNSQGPKRPLSPEKFNKYPPPKKPKKETPPWMRYL